MSPYTTNPAEGLVEAVAERVMEKIRAELPMLVSELMRDEREEEEAIYYTPREAARRVKCRDERIYQAIDEGEIDYVSTGGKCLIKPDDLLHWNELIRPFDRFDSSKH